MHAFIVMCWVYFTLLAVLCVKFWDRFKRENPNGRFRYRIMDIWALSLGLTPTLLLAAGVIKLFAAKGNYVETVLLTLAVGTAQLAGMFVSVLDFDRKQIERVSPWHSGLSVLAGAGLGLGLAIVCGFLAFGIGVALAALPRGLDIVLLVVSAGTWLYARRKRKV